MNSSVDRPLRTGQPEEVHEPTVEQTIEALHQFLSAEKALINTPNTLPTSQQRQNPSGSQRIQQLFQVMHQDRRIRLIEL